MFDSQLQFERLEQVPDQYRRNAALYAQRKLARETSAQSGPVHPLRRRFAAVLRSVANAVEPAPHQPPLNL